MARAHILKNIENIENIPVIGYWHFLHAISIRHAAMSRNRG